ncbi:MAG: HAD family hydrolase [Pseudomonadota bacterium]|nr:HAD family hydrolase [Pseudomonadota bacterium]
MLLRQAIRAISFDLDDTLWHMPPVLLRAENKLKDWLSRRYPRVVEHYPGEELRRLLYRVAANRADLAHDISALRRETLSLAAQHAGYDASVADEAFAVFYQARNEVVLFDDVIPTLRRLGKRYPLISVTNGNADLSVIGIDHLFQASVSPADVGYRKPHPAIFKAACETIRVAPEAVLHVGDDPLSDIEGARQAGLRTAWFNPAGRNWPNNTPPDVTIEKLDELSDHLLD